MRIEEIVFSCEERAGLHEGEEEVEEEEEHVFPSQRWVGKKVAKVRCSILEEDRIDNVLRRRRREKEEKVGGQHQEAD